MATTDFIVTDCPTHGVKVVSDLESFKVYASMALECATGRAYADHTVWHAVEGHDCWVCCDDMTIDPDSLI